MLLALDTSTSQASVALVRDERLLAELSWEVGRRHSQELPERMSQVLRVAGARPADLSAVAVALGPGSFNGARVAVTTAKMLALTLNIPVYGASTLDIIAYGHAFADGMLLAILEAGRGELYAGIYAASAISSAPSHDAHGQPPTALASDLWRLHGPAITDPEWLAEEIAGAALVCGEWHAETETRLRAALGNRVRFAPRLGGRRAAWLAALAAARAAHGHGADYDDPARLEPLYLRRPAITASARPENRAPTIASVSPTFSPSAASASGSEEGVARAL